MSFSRRLILLLFCALPGLAIRAQSAADTSVVTADSAKTDSPANEDTTTTEKEIVVKVPDSLRRVPDPTARSWQKDPDFVYANDPSYWKREELPKQPRGNESWFYRMLFSKGGKYFIYLLLGGLLLFAIVRILMENNLLFYRSAKKGRAASVKDPDTLWEDPDEGLRQALQAKEHRLAVRYLYIKALRRLGDKGVIRYHLQTTNQEYIQQLNGSPLERSFRTLTDIYDRVWYGEFVLTGGQFERIYAYFEDFYKSIGGK